MLSEIRGPKDLKIKIHKCEEKSAHSAFISAHSNLSNCLTESPVHRNQRNNGQSIRIGWSATKHQ